MGHQLTQGAQGAGQRGHGMSGQGGYGVGRQGGHGMGRGQGGHGMGGGHRGHGMGGGHEQVKSLRASRTKEHQGTAGKMEQMKLKHRQQAAGRTGMFSFIS